MPAFSLISLPVDLGFRIFQLDIYGLGFGNFAVEVPSGKNDPNTPGFFAGFAYCGEVWCGSFTVAFMLQ